MSTTKVLGYAGAGLILLAALFLLSAGFDLITSPDYEYDTEGNEIPRHFEEVAIGNMIGEWAVKTGFISLGSGIAGIVGAILIGKKNILSGVLMIVSSAAALYSIVGLIPFVVLLAAGIRVIKDRKTKNSE